MTRSRLVAMLARQSKTSTKKVEEIMDFMVDDIIECLSKGEKVTITGFGRFEMRDRKTKSYTNPKTQHKSQLAPVSIPGFKASGLLKKRINGQ